MPDVVSIEVTYESLVTRADPQFYRDRCDILEYVFSNGREFRSDCTGRGAYSNTVDYILDDLMDPIEDDLGNGIEPY